MDCLIPQNSWLLVSAVLLGVVWVATIWFLWRIAQVPRGANKIIKKLLAEVLFFHTFVPFIFWFIHKMSTISSDKSDVVMFSLCCLIWIVVEAIIDFITQTTERINKKMLPVVEVQR